MSKGAKDRAAAKRVVAEQRARERRRRVTLWTSVAVAVVLLAAGLIGWGVLAGRDDETANASVPAAAVDEGTAFAFGTGPVTIDVYEDFLCPICRQFENGVDATLQRMIAQNRVTVRYHPIAILDHLSNGTKYSTRSAAAVAAAAESGRFAEFHKLLFDNQPAEGGDGLTADRLIELGTAAGITGPAFPDAIRNKTYEGWAVKVTETASARGVTATPAVLVDGRRVTEANGAPPSAATLEARVAAAG